MSILHEYECRPCGHAWDVLWARYSIGPTEWSRQTLECAWCALQLTFPAELEANTWRHWCREHRSAVDRYPFLRQVRERIEASLAAAGPGGGAYRVCAINLSSVPCPKCRRVLSPEARNLSWCSRCGALGGHRETTLIRTVRPDSPWPPILRTPPSQSGRNPEISRLSRRGDRRRGSIAYSRKSEMMLRFVGCWLIGTLSLRCPFPV